MCLEGTQTWWASNNSGVSEHSFLKALDLRKTEKAMATHSSTLAWKIHGQRSLVGCSPWGRKESDTIEQLNFQLSTFTPWWRRIRGLWKLLDGRDWLQGKLGLVLMDGAMFSKSLIQFSVDGQGCVPSLLFDLWPNYGGGHEDNGDLLQKVPCMQCHT